MKIETVNKIVWWVPFRKLRDKTRNYLMKKSIPDPNKIINNRNLIYNEINQLSNYIKENKNKKLIYEYIDLLISELNKFKYSIPIKRVEDHEDRIFIEHYVDINKEYLEKGDILEFYGSTLYANKYSNKNNNFKIACGLFAKGKFDDKVDYYFDFEDENTLPDIKFDCILATQVLMYAIDIVQVLENFKKMLKPNGKLIITMPFMYTRGYDLNYVPDNTLNISPGGLLKLGEKVFGEGSTHNLKYYGNFNYMIYQYLMISKKENENIESLICKEDDQLSSAMIVGVIYDNKLRPDQTRPDQTRPDQTRPDQTRPDQTYILICEEYIYINNIIIINKLQPMLQCKIVA